MMINYQEYVESDIQWIGKIPAHWGLSKIGRHFKLERGRVISNVEIANNVGKYPVYSSQTKNNGQLGSINTYEFDGEYVSWTTDGANAGTCFYRKGKFNVTNVCGLISSFDIEIDYKFLSFFLNLGTKNFVRKDINPKLMNDMLSEIPVLIIPIKEQKLISQYLDKKTQKIDSLIKKIEIKIELMKEQKAALINQFVTKGLDQNVEKKDSGIDWIGEIPKHWITSRLKYITSRIGDGLHSTPKYVEDSEYHFINGNNLIDGEITIYPSTRCVSNDEYKKYLIELNQNCILLSINGTIGNLSLYEGESIILGKSCCYIKLKDSYSRDYFYWFLKSNSVFNYFKNQLTGTTIFNLSLESIRETNILIPPIKEQEEISKLLKKEYKRFTELTKQHYEKIRLLQEYRQSLISSVVTGKIRIKKDML